MYPFGLGKIVENVVELLNFFENSLVNFDKLKIKLTNQRNLFFLSSNGPRGLGKMVENVVELFSFFKIP